MAIFSLNYQSDVGFTRFAMVQTQFTIRSGNTSIPDEFTLIPLELLNFSDLVARNQCPLGFTPRRAKVYFSVSDEDYLLIPLPFVTRTASYFNFITELENNPLVQNFEILGERISHHPLVYYLDKL